MTKQNKKLARRILMTFGPLLVLVVAGWFYFTGGRYISTENAYIKTDILSIAPEVPGIITAVYIRENQPVQKGDLLFALDKAPYKIEREKAQANLVSAAAQIEAQKARYLQKEQDIEIAQAEYELAKKTYERRSTLEKRNSTVVSPEEMDNAAYALQTAEKRVVLLQQERAEILAMLNGDPDIAIDEHPLYEAAQAALDKAVLDLSRTEVRAPANGIVRHAPNIGDFAAVGLPVTNLALAENVWIEANYKETELTRVRPGQPVEVTVDTYPDQSWTGTVESISPATESEFSILPAQNATGNWVKVVQRIPVRIALDPEAGAPPLRAGMSTEVTIDVGVWPHMPGFIKE